MWLRYANVRTRCARNATSRDERLECVLAWCHQHTTAHADPRTVRSRKCSMLFVLPSATLAAVCTNCNSDTRTTSSRWIHWKKNKITAERTRSTARCQGFEQISGNGWESHKHFMYSAEAGIRSIKNLRRPLWAERWASPLTLPVYASEPMLSQLRPWRLQALSSCSKYNE